MSPGQRSQSIGYGLFALDGVVQLSGYSNPYAAGALAIVALYFLVPVWRDQWRCWRYGQGKELDIILRKTHPWVQVMMGQQDTYTHIASTGVLYTYRICVINPTSEIIRGIEVKLTDFESEDKGVNFLGTGSHLQFRHDHAGTEKQRDLPPTKDSNYQDGLFVDVFHYFLGKGYSWLAIPVLVNVERRIPVKRCFVTLTVTTTSGISIAEEYALLPRPNALPELKPKKRLDEA